MLVITVLNEKGGVGKTTTSVHLASALAIIGKRVVLIDASAQGHATLFCGLEKSPGLYDLLVRNTSWEFAARQVSHEVYEYPGRQVMGELLVVPSNIETRNIATSISDAFAVSDRLSELGENVDVVVFDTAPEPNLLHGAILMATDKVLYPTMLASLAFDGLIESIRHIEQSHKPRQQRGLNPIGVAGIIPIATRLQTREHRDNLQELEEAFPTLIWSPIPQSTIWESASREGRMVWQVNAHSKAARHALALGARMLEVMYG